MGEMLYANMDDAVPESQVRALRKGFLGKDVYRSLKGNNNLAEFKIVMEETDYGSAIFEGQTDRFETELLRTNMTKKLMGEMQYMISQSSYPLNEFLTRMLHRYQIENVVYVIETLKSNRPMMDLMRGADPLGDFPELKNVQPVDGDDYTSLYQQVLIDLPIGNYFRKFLDEITAHAASDDTVTLDAKFVADVLSDKSMLQIQNHLHKIWLQDFYTFCRTELGESSQRIMCDLLKFESDCMTIQIIENYGSMANSDGAMTYSERKKYISKVGYLYPERYEMLNNANDFKALQAAVESTEYAEMLSNVKVAGAENEVESRGKTLGKSLKPYHPLFVRRSVSNSDFYFFY